VGKTMVGMDGNMYEVVEITMRGKKVRKWRKSKMKFQMFGWCTTDDCKNGGDLLPYKKSNIGRGEAVKVVLENRAIFVKIKELNNKRLKTPTEWSHLYKYYEWLEMYYPNSSLYHTLNRKIFEIRKQIRNIR
jgi:hypothetical protein